MARPSQPEAVTLELFRHRFEQVCEEMGATLQRAAFSPNIKERRDFSCALLDASGETVALAAHIPVHLGSMPLAVRAAMGSVSMDPGDGVLLNDPFLGGTHLPDLTLVSPVYIHDERSPRFYVANRAHHADIGGKVPGSMPVCTSIEDEGYRITPVLAFVAGRPEPQVIDPLLEAVRTPEERMGDLEAQQAANRIGAARAVELCERFGADEIARWVRSLRRYSSRLVRSALREIPDGNYRFEDALDDDGVSDRPVRICCSIEVRGERIRVDFGGSSRSVPGPVNAPFGVTRSAVFYVMRCLTPRGTPANEGCLDPVEILAPEGSVVDARYPSAVGAGNVETSQRIVDVLLGALAQAVPDRFPAASQGTMNNIAIGGLDPKDRLPFAYYETVGGGTGAGPGFGGASAVHSHMTNTRNTPIEALEHAYPLLARRYSVRSGSGGAGRYDGGDGIVRELEVLTDATVTLISDRRVLKPYGLAGGSPGSPGRQSLVRADGTTVELPAKGTFEVRKGDRLVVETPGGGGWGEPR